VETRGPIPTELRWAATRLSIRHFDDSCRLDPYPNLPKTGQPHTSLRSATTACQCLCSLAEHHDLIIHTFLLASPISFIHRREACGIRLPLSSTSALPLALSSTTFHFSSLISGSCLSCPICAPFATTVHSSLPVSLLPRIDLISPNLPTPCQAFDG
jgi:hypothetical protein